MHGQFQLISRETNPNSLASPIGWSSMNRRYAWWMSVIQLISSTLMLPRPLTREPQISVCENGVLWSRWYGCSVNWSITYWTGLDSTGRCRILINQGGVPHGSTIGPSLFPLPMKDLLDAFDALPIFFSDGVQDSPGTQNQSWDISFYGTGLVGCDEAQIQRLR